MKSIFNIFFLFSFVIIFSSCEKNHLVTFQDHVYEIIGVSIDSLSQDSLRFENAEFIYRINVDELNVRKGPNTSYEVETTLTKDSKFLIDSVVGDWSKIKIPSYYIETSGYVSSKYIERTNEKYYEPRPFIIDKVFSDAENKTDLYINYFLVLLISALIGWYIYYKKVKIEETNQLAYISWGIVMFIAGLLSVFINIETIGYNGLFAIWLILSILFTIIQLLIKVPFKGILKKYLLLPVVIFGSFILGKLVVVAIIGTIILLFVIHALSNKKGKINNLGSKSSFMKNTQKKSETLHLSDVKIENGWIKTIDQNGKHIATMSDSNKSVAGIGSDFFVCYENGWIKTYDAKCKHIATMSDSNKIIRNVSGQTFTCKEGGWIKTYDKNCKHQNTRSA